LANPFLPDVDTIETDFDRAPWCEEIGSLVPHPLIDVITVGPLQALHGSYIRNAIRLGLELPEPSLKNNAPFAAYSSISRFPVMWSCQYPHGGKDCDTVAKQQRFHWQLSPGMRLPPDCFHIHSVNRAAPGTALHKGGFTGSISGASGITGNSKWDGCFRS